ncbi:hypothetical protein CLAFUW4_00502 [Fulvia fulva]|uniref:LisH domain-containing protein n=1 Tax=Passalora fulva TaxID=5499 RepID=A0A9Q8P498_PASFU|nr:uncharacterized protein CLAFUR5_00502 [Fulvia fulva]KAK4636112.1 hypothetical protein CLAFUR4_00503 [Fulvia fulva]KAK4637694.1 hypothetical protein CLAFUR0_00504 [Fulvia fulva]UJO12629.1 hypothetical protein CLAFUR5_00502 [Fulvia fulva]WPV08288.1 hypothetical protein CLAFUW4_00502 [Fulvia fulva]WPV24944.1 hypothetical protein CLAFUW7_00507 [Fulvia fulva]
MSSAAAALHSDHVNLLIFRYLQESGFESAALGLANDWHRPKDCRDPENYPFAHEIRRNELISVIQEGLHHDALQARVRKSQRKYRWTGIDARESIERQDGRAEHGAAARAASSNKRKGRPAVMRPPDEFPTPAPKRQRRSEGSDAQLNGDRDAMDVDAASADAEGEDDPDAVSPTVHSEPEQPEVMDRYDSMDIATQTEIKTGPKTSTMYWKPDQSDTPIMHSSWNPSLDDATAHILLVTGQSSCRYYSVPDSIDDARQIESMDDTLVPEDGAVTASTWRPDGKAAAYACESIRDEPGGEQAAVQMIFERFRTSELHKASYPLGAPLLEPYGMILFLCYSPDSRYLLAGRTKEGGALVQVWKARDPEDDGAQPIAWRLFDKQMLSATWISNETFVVCGEQGLSCKYQVDQAHEEVAVDGLAQLSDMPDNILTGPSKVQGLITHNANIFDFSYALEKLVIDKRHNIGVFQSAESRKLIFTCRLHNRAAEIGSDLEVDIPEGLTSLEIAPWEEREDDKAAVLDAEKPTLLAAAFEDGNCIIYEITKTDEGAPKCDEAIKLTLQEGPAIASQWSPNGEHLAVANEEVVQIWSVESFQPKNGVRHAVDATVVWRPTSEADETLGESIGDEEKTAFEPSLSWSADGESLAFAADKQIAVIRFRPSLQSEIPDTEQNGRISP